MRAALHDAELRHSCAPFLLAEGVPARVALVVLGYSRVRLTLGADTHVTPAKLKEAATAMVRVLD